VVNRSNYRLFKSYLEYLRSQAQLNDLSVERYWAYGKHLLLWADETPFSKAHEVKPAFACYLESARLDGEVADASGERALLTRLLQSG